MDFEILGWEAKGLRCPDGKIDLCKDGSKKINLIQMPNGTGKSTYLELIRGAETDVSTIVCNSSLVGKCQSDFPAKVKLLQ